MLSRRHLRIKVMQGLYAFFRDEEQDVVKAQKTLIGRVDNILTLYYYILSLTQEIGHFAQLRVDESKRKMLPTEEDLNPNLRFIENKVVQLIGANVEYGREMANRKIRWTDQEDLIRKIYNDFVESDEYVSYMNDGQSTFGLDKQILLGLFNKHVFEREDLHFFLGEKSIFWGDDYENACMMVVQTLKRFEETDDESKQMARLFKENYVRNVEEDKQFMVDLFRKTIANNKWFSEEIGEKTKNWEVERIATMDVLLMKMALCELVEFETIPIKVTLNEYIEMAKSYSTPKSKVFINGVLDKIVMEFKREDKIKKLGRGLVE